jgi:hypothetical protein
MGALDKLQRGYDSSGRPLFATRQGWQFYDRVNDHIGGKLVPVQGGWSFAGASANTHGLAMCMDFRSWNLSQNEIIVVTHFGRDLMGTMWYRTAADGFEEHIHNNLLGDSPATDAALAQIPQYKAGLNGLANHARDRDPYRPKSIHNYRYIEDDMFTDKDRADLQSVLQGVQASKRRDQHERDRDKARFTRMVTILGKQADQLTLLINQTSDDATKKQLTAAKQQILQALKDDPDVTGVDNPDDSALA